MILNGKNSPWQNKNLTYLFKIVTGSTPSTKSESFWKDGNVLWVTPTDLSSLGNNVFISNSERKITNQALSHSNLTLLPIDSIILSTRAPVGYVAINKKELCFNQGCKALVIKDEDKTDSLFYYYYFLFIRNYLESISGGSTFKELSKDSLKNLSVPLPDISEQTAIANILSTVDEAIQKADEAITKTERIKQAMMKKLLSEGVGHKEYKQTKIGKIPKDWGVVRLNRYANILGGFAFKSSDYTKTGIPLIRIANVSFGEIVFEDLAHLPKAYLDKFDEYKVKKDDILLALTRPIISGGLKASIINSEHTPALLNQRVAKINTRDEKQVQQNYLKHFVLSPYFFKQMLQAQTSTNQPNVSTKQIEGFQIIIPDPVEQKNISDILEEAQNKIKLSIKRKSTLERIKQGLMDDLLTGKKRIKIN